MFREEVLPSLFEKKARNKQNKTKKKEKKHCGTVNSIEIRTRTNHLNIVPVCF